MSASPRLNSASSLHPPADALYLAVNPVRFLLFFFTPTGPFLLVRLNTLLRISVVKFISGTLPRSLALVYYLLLFSDTMGCFPRAFPLFHMKFPAPFKPTASVKRLF